MRLFRSRYVLLLEEERLQNRERERALLDRLLMVHGYAPLTDAKRREVTPNQQPVRPWRRMARMEAQANRDFDQFQRDFNPSVDDILKAKKEAN